MAAHGDGDIAVVKRIEHGEIALAGHAEGVADTVDDQLVDQHLGGGAQIVLGFHVRFPGIVSPHRFALGHSANIAGLKDDLL